MNGQSVTWKWLVGILVGVLTLGGAGWMTNMQAQVTQSGKDAANQSADIAVIKEKLRVIEENQKEQKDSQKEINKKLDEIKESLRSRQSLQNRN